VGRVVLMRDAITWLPEMDAALVSLRADGFGYNACGDKIGVSNMAVYRRAKALSLPTWGRGGGRRLPHRAS
jgi:hypothetical protein